MEANSIDATSAAGLQPGSEHAVSAALTEWQANGCKFLNYFGLQRFGNSADAGTHHVGRCFLMQQWREVVGLLLQPRSGESAPAAAARSLYAATRDAARALAALPRHMHIEGVVLRALAEASKKSSSDDDSVYAAACNSLPAYARQLYVHAYQSLLWNKLASARYRVYGAVPVVGDLVFVAESAESAISEAEDVEDASSSIGPCRDTGESDSFGSTLPAVRVLTSTDIAAGAYAISDIVLPLPGTAVVYPENDCGAAALIDLLRCDGFVISSSDERLASSLSAFWKSMPQALQFTGGYRKLVGTAADFSWRVLRHQRSDDDLQFTDVDLLRAQEGATAVTRSCSESVPTASALQLSPAGRVSRLTPAALAGGPLLAVQLCFSLSKSCYATMAIREAMKQSSDKPLYEKSDVPGLTASAASSPSVTSVECAAGAVPDPHLGAVKKL